jgi:hypothetical protein
MNSFRGSPTGGKPAGAARMGVAAVPKPQNPEKYSFRGACPHKIFGIMCTMKYTYPDFTGKGKHGKI